MSALLSFTDHIAAIEAQARARSRIDAARVNHVADQMAMLMSFEEGSLKEMRDCRANGDDERAGLYADFAREHRKAYDHYANGICGEAAEAELVRRGLL